MVSNAVAGLMDEYKRFNGTTMNELFAAEAGRAEKYTLNFEGMTFDYSKNRFDDKVLAALFELAREHNLESRIEDM